MKLPRPFTASHHRLHLFWGLAVLGLAAPWFTSCDHPSVTALLQEERACTVNSIHDGDTMRLTCDGEQLKVRLYCIDAPELSQKPWGQESRDHLRVIAPKQVILIPRDKDRYGRTVGEVLSSDADRENLNLAQVWSGNAAVYPQYCSDRRYFTAEDNARGVRAGIWEKAGSHQTPWRTRR
jgi:endonuclease YncB( thermonuclease family)